MLLQTGEASEAKKDIETACARLEQLPTSMTTSEQCAILLVARLALFKTLGDREGLLEAYGPVIEARRRLLEAHPRDASQVKRLAELVAGQATLRQVLGDRAGARTDFREALRLWESLLEDQPSSPDYASQVAATLNDIAIIDLAESRFQEARERLERATELQQRAIAADGKNEQYRQFLMNHLGILINACGGMGDPAAGAKVRELREEAAASDPRYGELDEQLALALAGDQSLPPARKLELAQRAYYRGLYRGAARLYTEALDAEAPLAGDPAAAHRYNAACCEALAGTGFGRDQQGLDDPQRARLRADALELLQADFADFQKRAGEGPQREQTVQILRHWLRDPDLSGIRDEEALRVLPEAERERLSRFWQEVRRVAGQRRTAA